MATRRSQPYRLTWPLTPSQVEGIDEMLEILFKAIRSLQDTLTSPLPSGGGGGGVNLGQILFLGSFFEDIGGVEEVWPAIKFGPNFQGDLSIPATAAFNYDNLPIIIAQTALNNYFFGGQAGNFTTSGSNNTALGRQALRSLTLGGNNVAVGANALILTDVGVGNVAMGKDALFHNTGGNGNMAMGNLALTTNIGGSSNIALGDSAIFGNTTGSNNIGIGPSSLAGNTTGSNNIGIGPSTLGNASTATDSKNIAIGNGTLFDVNNGGGNNIGLGFNTGRGITTGKENVILGGNVTGLSAGLSNNIILADGAGTQRVNIDDSGRVGIGLGVGGAAAFLHIKAGVAGSSSAPLKFTSGTSLTSPEAGAVEFTTDTFSATITTGVARKGIVLDDGTRLTSGSIPVATTNGRLIDGTVLTSLAPFAVHGRSDAQTAAVVSIVTTTVGAADASYTVSANINITTSVGFSFSCTCAYTDETNASRTLTLNFSQLTGAFVTSITNVLGTGAYEGVPVHIRCKAGTSITLATTGTFTSVTYNVDGCLFRLS